LDELENENPDVRQLTFREINESLGKSLACSDLSIYKEPIIKYINNVIENVEEVKFNICPKILKVALKYLLLI